MLMRIREEKLDQAGSETSAHRLDCGAFVVLHVYYTPELSIDFINRSQSTLY